MFNKINYFIPGTLYKTGVPTFGYDYLYYYQTTHNAYAYRFKSENIILFLYKKRGADKYRFRLYFLYESQIIFICVNGHFEYSEYTKIFKKL